MSVHSGLISEECGRGPFTGSRCGRGPSTGLGVWTRSVHARLSSGSGVDEVRPRGVEGGLGAFTGLGMYGDNWVCKIRSQACYVLLILFPSFHIV